MQHKRIHQLETQAGKADGIVKNHKEKHRV